MLISLIVLELCPRQDFSKRGDNSKMELNRVMVLLQFLPNDVYLPTKFHVDISNNQRVMFRTKFSVKMNKGK
jgi:hypothetical protein